MLAGTFNIFLIRNFMKSIPKALDEAATIDGASSFQVYTKIILPSIAPVMIVVGLFAFNGAMLLILVVVLWKITRRLIASETVLVLGD